MNWLHWPAYKTINCRRRRHLGRCCQESVSKFIVYCEKLRNKHVSQKFIGSFYTYIFAAVLQRADAAVKETPLGFRPIKARHCLSVDRKRCVDANLRSTESNYGRCCCYCSLLNSNSFYRVLQNICHLKLVLLNFRVFFYYKIDNKNLYLI